MRTIAFLIMSVAFTALCAPGANAAPDTTPATVFRHMSWRVTVGIRHSSERSRSTDLGSSSNAGGGDMHAVAGGTDTQSSGGSAVVDVSIDVVGTLPDSGLAVLVRETGDRTVEPVRLDIIGAGSVVSSAADQAKLTPEEGVIAALCARKLLADHPLVAGETWTNTAEVRQTKTRATYRIKEIGPDGMALVEVDETLRASAIGAVTQHTYGTFTYDPVRTVPATARLSRITQSGQLGALNTTEESFEYRLITDTLPRPVR